MSQKFYWIWARKPWENRDPEDNWNKQIIPYRNRDGDHEIYPTCIGPGTELPRPGLTLRQARTYFSEHLRIHHYNLVRPVDQLRQAMLPHMLKHLQPGDRVTVGPPDEPITFWIEEARP